MFEVSFVVEQQQLTLIVNTKTKNQSKARNDSTIAANFWIDSDVVFAVDF